jgi:hypothetical protein
LNNKNTSFDFNNQLSSEPPDKGALRSKNKNSVLFINAPLSKLHTKNIFQKFFRKKNFQAQHKKIFPVIKSVRQLKFFLKKVVKHLDNDCYNVIFAETFL